MMQAIILAAGMGKRLKDLTQDSTKCMVKVNGVTMIERMLTLLDRKNLSRIVIVVGYKGQKLIDYIGTLSIKTPIVFVENTVYDKTNNIYSLYLARKYLKQENTLLLESDLVFEEKVLDRILDDPYPSLALVAKFESWMDGTVIVTNEHNDIRSFIPKKDFDFAETSNYYKTVNIYKFSKDFSATHYVPFLEAYCKALGNNEYYEQVLKVIAMLDKPDIKAVKLDGEAWYEIDDIQDLRIAECIFATPEQKLEKLQKSYGGYWRYPRVLDFCYLVNPFFPNRKLLDEIKTNFEELLCSYPSGMGVNSLLAAKDFGLQEKNTVVGNGAAELIKSLMSLMKGKVGVILPTFEEYPNRLPADRVVPFTPQNDGFRYTADELISFFSSHPVSALVLINPDNPSGNMVGRDGLLSLLDWAKEKRISLVLDESFLDFADDGETATLMDEEILNQYPNLYIVKSLSKAFGIPGIRLGVLASGNTAAIDCIKKDVSIWNINSFAEYFLQIFEKYKSEYRRAMQQFREVRSDFILQLGEVPNLRVLPTQANYVMCELLNSRSAKSTAVELLEQYHILSKDLSPKKGCGGREYMRFAIRTKEDNLKLLEALKKVLG